MTAAAFEVGRVYRPDAPSPTVTILARNENGGSTEVVIRTDCGVEDCLEVMWCDLAGSEVVALPKPWNKALYPVSHGNRDAFA